MTAGHTSSIRRKPAITVTKKAGMMTARNGVWRPTICETATGSSPDACPAVRMRMPKSPKATGAVFASSAKDAAYMGSNPRPAMSEPVIATGVPKAAMASRSAPKTKAITKTCMRRSW
jgi:hypothetical protein